MRTFVIAALVLAPALAHADSDTLFHVSAGFEPEGGTTGVYSLAFRGQALLGNAFGSGSVRTELAAGATLGAGQLFAQDPRALSNAVGLDMTTFGPELQVAFQFYDHEVATTRLFASFAYLHLELDQRLALDPIAGVSNDANGARGSIGVNYARTLFHKMDCESMNHCDTLFAFLLPTQAEFAVEHDAGSTRYGATLSWGI